MNTLIIYDNTGYIIDIRSGSPLPREPQGIPFLWVTIPDKKRIVSVNISATPNIPIYEDIPLTEIEEIKQTLDFLIMGGM